MRPGECDPPAAFEKHYKGEFASAAEKYFDSAVESAAIDVQSNARDSDILHKLIDDHSTVTAARKRWILLLVLLLAGLIIWGIVLLASDDMASPAKQWILFGTAAGAGLVFLFAVIIPKLRKLSAQIAQLGTIIEEKKQELLAKLAGLYDYFSWHTLHDLITKILPELHFDPFLNNARLADLQKNFDAELPHEDKDSSLIGAESGSFFGYPFIISRARNFDWGEKTWEGSLSISWEEEERNSEGKYVTVTKHEVLYASITRPAPEYSVSTTLFAGHEAAPDLKFSRKPSPVSGKDSFFSGINRKLIMGKLRRLEQDLTDDLPYTMMSNRDFEVQFHATDRNHEVQFRLLFTPLAQQYMVKLMNDNSVGYGDDFYVFKQGKNLCLIPEHLQEASVADDPFYSDHFDLRLVKKQFMDQSEEYFRSIFFAFAPLMCIPLYTEERLEHETVQTDPADISALSPAELETAVNRIGEEVFRHPESITENILKIRSIRITEENTVTAEVHAAGFRGVEHVEYVSRMGGDKRWYEVPVEWVEYIPVTHTTPISAQYEAECPEEETVQDTDDPESSARRAYRRSIVIDY